MQLALNLPNPLAARQSLFIDHDQPFTTSRAIAERFGKWHRDVLRATENLINNIPDPAFRERNFALTFYPVPGPNGAVRQEPEYRLTHDGFALLAMRFTGSEALAWQIAFLSAFNALEAELKSRVERESLALYRLRPHWRPILDGTESGRSRLEICAATGHRSPNTITANRRRLRAAGLLPQRAAILLGLKDDPATLKTKA
ncbi:MAG: Rha family transcriptional regulator [Sulfuricellaceae bacterium]